MRFGPRALLSSAAVPLLVFVVGCGEDGPSGLAATAATATSSTGTGGTGGGGDGGAGAGTALRIANWNVHNMFDDQKDSSEDVVSKSEYEAHVADVGTVLAAENPDIVMFAEVENTSVLDDIAAQMGGGYESTLIEGNDPRLIHIGVLSRVPFTDVVSHKDDEFTLSGSPAPTYSFVRDCLEVHFTYGGRDIVLLGVHFRSKGQPDANPPVPDDADRRGAEAERTRAIADGLTAANPELGLVVLGDFNDLPTSYPYKAVAKSDYENAPDALPESERYSYIYSGTKELIDHQLSNPVMSAWLDPAEVTIVHSNTVDDASDHSPVVATYRVK